MLLLPLCFRFCLLFVCFPLALLALQPSLQAESSSAERIATLVKQLGSDDYTEREAASKALVSLGEATRAALEKAAAANADAEVCQRAKDLVQKLDDAWYRELQCRTCVSGEGISVLFSPDGKQGLSVSRGTLLRWDLQSGKAISSFDVGIRFNPGVAFSRDGTRAFSCGFGFFKLWNLKTGKLQREWGCGERNPVLSVALSPDGKEALSGCDDHTVRLWDLATGKELRCIKGHKDRVTSVAFSPDGKRALSGSMDTTMSLWDLKTGKELRCFTGHTRSVLQVAFSPDAKQIFSIGAEGSLRAWEVETGRLLRRFQEKKKGSLYMALSPDGKRLLSGGLDGILRLWDVETGKELRSFNGHTDQITSIAFSPDGKRALTGSKDHSMRLWQVAPPGK